MYKQKLQELCQKRRWAPPLYTCARDGPDHNPRFWASVTVDGATFDGPQDASARTSKEAHNAAARVAYHHFAPSAAATEPSPAAETSTAAPQPAPQPLGLPSCSSSARIAADDVPARNEVLKGHGSDVNASAMGARDMQYLYKIQLQSYAQKRNLNLPTYECVREGSIHAPRFKALVTVAGHTFASPQFCTTLKDAEHAAAKAALIFLSTGANQEEEHGFYKNLLQELSQKEGLTLPTYSTVSDGPSHMPTFSSTVEIEGERFEGGAAKTKKQAEINAAKVAWARLRERKLSRLPAGFSSRFQMIDINDTFASLSSTGSQLPGAGQLPVLCAKPDEEDNSSRSDNRAEIEVKSTDVRLISPLRDDEEAHVTEQVGGGGNGDSAEPEWLQVPNSTQKKGQSRSLSSSDAVYGTLRDPFPDEPTSSDDEISSASSPSECVGHRATGGGTSACPAESGSGSLLCNRVRIYPRKPDFQLPPGTELLPFSDETWVAVSVEHSSEATGPIAV